MRIDKNYFPGFTRKAISFTNDDGNLPLDRKFIDIVKPYGFKGTFNISGRRRGVSKEEYRSLYDGFGIANHCALHPFVLRKDTAYDISDEPFSENADGGKIYRTETDGIFRIKTSSGWWSHIATEDKYIELVEAAQREIEDIFGTGVCQSFVWPYCEQESEKVKEYLKSRFISVRRTGTLRDSTAFSMPKDRYSWSYNAVHNCLVEVGRLFEKYPDDGELKLLVFGLHSHDYENGRCWHLLEEFAREFGNREEFYYADIDTLFRYEDAINALEISESEIINHSNLALYLTLDGEKIIVPENGKIILK